MMVIKAVTKAEMRGMRGRGKGNLGEKRGRKENTIRRELTEK